MRVLPASCKSAAQEQPLLQAHRPSRLQQTGRHLRMAGKYVIGIDGGTESLRAGVFDAQGTALAYASASYPTSFPRPGWAEQDPADWWAALGAATRQAVAAAGVSPGDVVGLSLDTTCCTVVALDAAGTALRPALLWMDMRSAAQAQQLLDTGDPALQVNSGGAGPVSAEWMCCKALWLAQQEPEVYGAATWVAEYQDYLNYHLTGVMVGSINNASVRWHYHEQRGWPDSLLAAVGLSSLRTKWPQRLLRLGEVVGGLTPAAATHLGLAPGTLVAQGGADAFIGMLGLGVVAPGDMALLTGSSHLHLGMAAAPLSGRGMFGSYPSAVLPGVHVVEGGQTSTGSIINWLRSRVLGAPPGQGEGPLSYAALNAAAADIPPGCEGLTCLDHFQGNRTPHTDPLSRGALVGLTLAHTPAHLYRAALEGVCYGTRLVLDTMAAGGYTPGRLVVAGGATRSELWLQMHADVTQTPLVMTECGDAPALGCAILAAVAAGLHPDIPAAVAAMVRVTRVVTPDPAAAAAYAAPYERYRALYPSLKDVFHSAAAKAEPTPSKEQPSDPSAQANKTETAAAAAAAAVAAAAASPCAKEAAAGRQQAVPGCSGRLVVAAAAVASQVAGSAALAAPEAQQQIRIAPSILAANFAALGAAVQSVVAAGAEWVHVDMFDGTWAPNFTLGPPVVAALRAAAPAAYLDCHLAVQDPSQHLPALLAARPSGVTIQVEPFLNHNNTLGANNHRNSSSNSSSSSSSSSSRPDPVSWSSEGLAACRAVLRSIAAGGARPGVALGLLTPPEVVAPLVEGGEVDLVLVMSVPCGFGGQSFQPAALDKLAALRASWPQLELQVDGGINVETAPAAAAAGANVLVAGSAVFGAAGGVADAIRRLRAAAAAGAAGP